MFRAAIQEIGSYFPSRSNAGYGSWASSLSVISCPTGQRFFRAKLSMSFFLLVGRRRHAIRRDRPCVDHDGYGGLSQIALAPGVSAAVKSIKIGTSDLKDRDLLPMPQIAIFGILRRHQPVHRQEFVNESKQSALGERRFYVRRAKHEE